MITKNCLIFIKNKFYNFDKHPKYTYLYILNNINKYYQLYLGTFKNLCDKVYFHFFFTLEKLRFNKFKHTHRAFVLILQK